MCKKTILNSCLVAPGVALRSGEASAFRLRRHVHRRWNESPRDAGTMMAAAHEDVLRPSTSRSLDPFFSHESQNTLNEKKIISMEIAEESCSRSAVVVGIPDTVFERASSIKFPSDESNIKSNGGEGPQLAPGSPWWCTRVACAANVLLLVLVFTALLMVFRRARMSENDMEVLEEELEGQGGSIEKTTDKTLQGFIIDLPCRPGFKYFRGRCRRMF